MATKCGHSRLVGWADDTAFHGIKRCLNPSVPKWRRTIWAVFVVTAICLVVWNIVDRWLVYFEYNTATVVDLKFHPPLPFPAITFCNMNRNRKSTLTPLDLYMMGSDLFITDENNTLLNPERHTSEFRDFFNDINFTEVAQNASQFHAEEFEYRTGHRIEDMLVKCKFRKKKCKPADFRQVMTELGTCDVFNADGNLMLDSAGKGSGLKVVFTLEPGQYSPATTEYGMVVALHGPHEKVNVLKFGRAVRPGHRHYGALRMRTVSTMPAPYSECQSVDPDTGGQYTVAGCQDDCLAREMISQVGCRMFYMNEVQGPLCGRGASKLLRQVKNTIYERELCACRSECSATKYNMKLTSLVFRPRQWIADHEDDLLDSGITANESEIMNGLLQFDFYFEELSVEYVQHVPAYTVPMLITELGGNMGLLIGMSFLAVGHLLELCGLDILLERCRTTSADDAQSDEHNIPGDVGRASPELMIRDAVSPQHHRQEDPVKDVPVSHHQQVADTEENNHPLPERFAWQ